MTTVWALRVPSADLCLASSSFSKKSCAIDAGVAGSFGASSTGGGRLDRSPMLRLWKYDELRRATGDRGGILPSPSLSELVDVLLCKAGGDGLSLPPSELELGARRRGVLADRDGMIGEAFW